MSNIYLTSVSIDYIPRLTEILERAGLTVILDGKDIRFGHLTRVCIETGKNDITIEMFRATVGSFIDDMANRGGMYS